MKQNIKRLLLMLCMITCFFALTACQKSDSSDGAVDSQMSASVSEWAASLLEQLSTMSVPEIENEIALAEQSKDKVFSEGLTAWLAVKTEAGNFQEVLSTEVAETDHGLSCTVKAQFENRKVEYKVFLNDEGGIESMSFSPEYTVGEKMTKAGMNTLMGMGTVFVVLIFISFLISCFKFIGVYENRMREKTASIEPVSQPVPAPAVETVPEPEADPADDLELVAVITAAIAAAEGTSADGLVVRSIKRASAGKWKRA